MNMQSNIILDDNSNVEGYQIIVTGISWSKDSIGKYRSKKDFSDRLPDQMTFILPEALIKNIKDPCFNDEVETFVYNLLARRFNRIAHHAQIWLPLEEVA